MPTLMDEVRAGYERGWSFTPLHGKRPTLNNWQAAERETLEQALEWARRGNVGLRTGAASGVVVIDVDDPSVQLAGLPPTPVVITGGGGRHYYFAIEPGGLLGNSVKKLAPGIDTRGDRGQVVFVGSIHPETGKSYAWEDGKSPADVALARFPIELMPEAAQRRYRAGVLRFQGKTTREIAAILGCGEGTVRRDLGASESDESGASGGAESGAALRHNGADLRQSGAADSESKTRSAPLRQSGAEPGTGAPPSAPHFAPPAPPPPPGPPPPATGPAVNQAAYERSYAASALEREIDTLTNQPSGGRNKQLNEAAMKLGSLVVHGLLDEGIVRSRLRDACIANGLIADDGEGAFQATMNSGLEHGKSTPRDIPPPRPRVFSDDEAEYALTPGTHVDDNGMRKEITGGDFARDVLSRLPADFLYRRDTAAGVVIGDRGAKRFRPLEPVYACVALGDHVKPGKWVKPKRKDADAFVVFEPFTETRSKLVIAQAGQGGQAPNIDVMVNYPMLTADWRVPQPGYNSDGTYYDQPEDLEDLEIVRDMTTIRATLLEPICDFPFRTDADRDNFIGLMLTPILRRAIGGCTPLHVVDAPAPGTGKTKLIEEVFGISIQGDQLAGMTWPDDEAEARKVILSVLMSGVTLWHMDNVKGAIESPALASLLTTKTVTDRVLGGNTIATLPNTMTVIANGNNVKFDTDMVRRTVHIRLEPDVANPSERTRFRHPDLAEYVRSHRRQMLGSLIGMALNWLDAGSPPHPKLMGSFERWSKVIGGVLQHHGFHAWRANEREFRSSVDDFAADLDMLVAFWQGRHGFAVVRPAHLLMIAKENNLFMEALATARTPNGEANAFSKRVLMNVVGRTVGSVTVVRRSSGANGEFLLRPAKTPDAD